jgi:hypothetical protein
MAVSKSKVVGVIAFDLSCAFDTVAKDRLLTKLQAMGINGTELAWFDSYMTGGLQAVVWDGVRSRFVCVRFGVRQGSILGPLLYLCHVADLPNCLGLGEEENSGYADDTGVWVVHDNPAVVEMELQVLADKFLDFTNTFVSHGSAVWNACVDLRKAATKSEALRAVTAFTRNAPV